MGLDKAIFSYSNFKTLLEQVTSFLDEHIPNKFSSNFPKLIHSTKWKFDYILARKKLMMAKKIDNTYIPKFVPNNLPWYERNGLNTWYEQNKCNDFL